MSRTYTTIQGDKWDSIAFQQLGDVIHTDKLMNLNPAYLDYYIFPAGIKLRLPNVSTAVTGAQPPWKQGVG